MLMEKLTTGTLWQALQAAFVVINAGTTLELTRVEYGPSGDVEAITFVPFVGEALVLRIVDDSTQPAR